MSRGRRREGKRGMEGDLRGGIGQGEMKVEGCDGGAGIQYG